jgi:hypothetical protein
VRWPALARGAPYCCQEPARARCRSHEPRGRSWLLEVGRPASQYLRCAWTQGGYTNRMGLVGVVYGVGPRGVTPWHVHGGGEGRRVAVASSEGSK